MSERAFWALWMEEPKFQGHVIAPISHPCQCNRYQKVANDLQINMQFENLQFSKLFMANSRLIASKVKSRSFEGHFISTPLSSQYFLLMRHTLPHLGQINIFILFKAPILPKIIYFERKGKNAWLPWQPGWPNFSQNVSQILRHLIWYKFTKYDGIQYNA